jgi:hypothetical protein
MISVVVGAWARAGKNDVTAVSARAAARIRYREMSRAIDRLDAAESMNG